MLVAGSPRALGYFGLAPHPSMLSCIGENAFHWKSRIFTIWFLPPNMPSMSLVMLPMPDSPAPIYVGMWKRMYSHSPPVWSPDHTPP